MLCLNTLYINSVFIQVILPEISLHVSLAADIHPVS